MILRKFHRRVFAAIAWRVRRALGHQQTDRIIVKIAQGWRVLLKKPVFIGIAGSAGKTTTKELMLGVLSRQGCSRRLNLDPGC